MDCVEILIQVVPSVGIWGSTRVIRAENFLLGFPMFGLVAGLWEIYHRKPEFSVLILGLDNAGKTTCLEQMKRMYPDKKSGIPKVNDLHRIYPTVGLNIGRLEIEGKKLLVWDLGGQAGLRVIWEKYYSEAHALIYVIDAAEQKRIEESHKELENILAHEELAGVPVLIFANKQDIETSLTADEISKMLNFTNVDVRTSKRSFRVEQISALQGSGIDKGISWILSMLSVSSRSAGIPSA